MFCIFYFVSYFLENNHYRTDHHYHLYPHQIHHQTSPRRQEHLHDVGDGLHLGGARLHLHHHRARKVWLWQYSILIMVITIIRRQYAESWKRMQELRAQIQVEIFFYFRWSLFVCCVFSFFFGFCCLSAVFFSFCC